MKSLIHNIFERFKQHIVGCELGLRGVLRFAIFMTNVGGVFGLVLCLILSVLQKDELIDVVVVYVFFLLVGAVGLRFVEMFFDKNDRS